MVPMGRPKSDNPKSVFVGVRLTEETVEKLDECVKDDGSSRSEIIRKGIERIYEDKTKE